MKLLPLCGSSLVILSLTACSISSPVIVNIQNGNESQLNCMQLSNEIEAAKRYKEAAREEDRFMLKHVNPFTTFFSIYNMNKAESNAQKRIDYLQGFYRQKQCDHIRYTPPASSYNPRMDETF